MPTIKNEEDLRKFQEGMKKDIKKLMKDIKNLSIVKEINRLKERLANSNNDFINQILESKIVELEELITTN